MRCRNKPIKKALVFDRISKYIRENLFHCKKIKKIYRWENLI